MLNLLEIRYYKQNSLIAAEMDECMEVLFVEQGFYRYGYEINNHEYYKRRFGMFTVIGGFNICYDKRFMFIIRSATDLKGLAIRKQNFRKLLWEYPDFALQLKHKFWKHYCIQVLIPLKKRKNADLIEYNQRQDYKQILILKNKNKEKLITECMRENLKDLGINILDNIQ